MIKLAIVQSSVGHRKILLLATIRLDVIRATFVEREKVLDGNVGILESGSMHIANGCGHQKKSVGIARNTKTIYQKRHDLRRHTFSRTASYPFYTRLHSISIPLPFLFPFYLILYCLTSTLSFHSPANNKRSRIPFFPFLILHHYITLLS